MIISLIHPSRGRPYKSWNTVTDWLLGTNPSSVDVIVSVDSDDSKADEYRGMYHNKVIVNDNKSLVEATNRAAKHAKGDILVYLSDDFRCPNNWDQLILKEFEACTTPRILKIDDKLQDFHVRVLTAPIMNRAAYEQLGYFFNPLYKSMWVDCDLYEVAHRRGWIKPCKHLVFPHEHVSNGMAPDDETYRRSAANWDQGKAVFEERKRMRFA